MRLQYRPDIDGLRALAVTAVVLFHSEIIIFGAKFFGESFFIENFFKELKF